jgi:AraC family transcriptional regulator, transcriptional activator of pobA
VDHDQTLIERAHPHTMEHLCIPDVRTTFQLHSMHIRSVRKGWMYPEHEHRQLFEICLVLDGCYKVKVEGKTYLQQPNQLLLILPNHKHESEVGPTSHLSMFCLHFAIDDELFVNLLHEHMNQTLYDEHSPVTKRIRDILEKLIVLAHNSQSLTVPQRMKIHAFSFELFTAISESIMEDPVDVPGDELDAHLLARRIANRIEHAVYHNANDNGMFELQQIQHIAGQLHISPTYCNRIFQKIFGMSPRRYLSKMKLERAQNLLSDTNMSVEKVAQTVGYRDSSQFSRQFKRWTGMSPSQHKVSRAEKRAATI